MPIYQKDSLIGKLSKDWLNRQKMLGTKAACDYLSGMDRTVAELETIRSTDIRMIIDMEIIALEYEMALYGEEDKTVIPTLQTAINALSQDVKGAISTAEIPEDYRKQL